MSDLIQKLQDKGFSGADIHYFLMMFDIGIEIYLPTVLSYPFHYSSEKIKEIEQKHKQEFHDRITKKWEAASIAADFENLNKINMEAQYYTPAIEEFHVGFIFEEEMKNWNWRKLMRPPQDVFSFERFEFNTSHSISRIISKINQDRVRVKYLDTEDILSLGWEFQKKEGPVSYFEQKNRLLWYNFISKKMIVIVKDPSKSEVYLLNDIHRYVHNININNVSEFKKLMNQINFFDNE